MEPQAVAMLEAAYRLDRSEEQWVEGVREAFEPSVRGAALVQAYVFDASDVQNLKMRTIRGGTDEQNRWMKSTEGPGYNAGESVQRVFAGESGPRIASEALGHGAYAEMLAGTFANPWGLIDGWGVVAGNLAGRGLALGALSTHRVGPVAPSIQARWQAVSAHVSAAFCLREAMAAGLAPAEAVLGADGKVLHLEGEARLRDARDSLRQAVRAIDRARSRHRRQSSEALEAWQAVVSGRWTLIDQTESDGRRLLLARVNELPVRPVARLSEREAQVLGLAAQGQSNKQIGYRLGVGPAAVSNYLKRAAQKMGVTSRRELVRRAVAGGGPEEAGR